MLFVGKFVFVSVFIFIIYLVINGNTCTSSKRGWWDRLLMRKRANSAHLWYGVDTI